VKRNPFSWLPFWPDIEDSHILPIVIVGLITAAILIWFAFD